MTTILRKNKLLMIIASIVLLSALIVILCACGTKNTNKPKPEVEIDKFLNTVTVDNVYGNNVTVRWGLVKNATAYKFYYCGEQMGKTILPNDELYSNFSLKRETGFSRVEAQIDGEFVTVGEFDIVATTQEFVLDEKLEAIVEDEKVGITFNVSKYQKGYSGYLLSVSQLEYLFVPSSDAVDGVVTARYSREGIIDKTLKIRAVRDAEIKNGKKTFYVSGWSPQINVKINESITNIYYYDFDNSLKFEAKDGRKVNVSDVKVEITDKVTTKITDSTVLDLSEFEGRSVSVTVTVRRNYNAQTNDLNCSIKYKPIDVRYIAPVENLRLEYGVLRWDYSPDPVSYAVKQLECDLFRDNVGESRLTVKNDDIYNGPQMSDFSANKGYSVSVKPIDHYTNTYSVYRTLGWFMILQAPRFEYVNINTDVEAYKDADALSVYWSSSYKGCNYGFTSYIKRPEDGENALFERYDLQDATGDFQVSLLNAGTQRLNSIKGNGSTTIDEAGIYSVSVYALPSNNLEEIKANGNVVRVYPSRASSFTFEKLQKPDVNYVKSEDGKTITFTIDKSGYFGGYFDGYYEVSLPNAEYAEVVRDTDSEFVFKIENSKISDEETAFNLTVRAKPNVYDSMVINSARWTRELKLSKTISLAEMGIRNSEQGYYIKMPEVNYMGTLTYVYPDGRENQIITFESNAARQYLLDLNDHYVAGAQGEYKFSAYSLSDSPECFSGKTTTFTFQKLEAPTSISATATRYVNWVLPSDFNVGKFVQYEVLYNTQPNLRANTNFYMDNLLEGENNFAVRCVAVENNDNGVSHYYLNSDYTQTVFTKLKRPDLFTDDVNYIKNGVLSWSKIDNNEYDLLVTNGSARVYEKLNYNNTSVDLNDILKGIGATSSANFDVLLKITISTKAPNVNDNERRIFSSDEISVEFYKKRQPTLYMRSSIIQDCVRGIEDEYNFFLDGANMGVSTTFIPDNDKKLSAGIHNVYCINVGGYTKDGLATINSEPSKIEDVAGASNFQFVKLQQANLTFGALEIDQATFIRDYNVYITVNEIEFKDKLVEDVGRFVKVDNNDTTRITQDFYTLYTNNFVSGTHEVSVIRIGDGITTIDSNLKVLTFTKLAAPNELSLRVGGILGWETNYKEYHSKLLYQRDVFGGDNTRDCITLKTSNYTTTFDPTNVSPDIIGKWIDGDMYFGVYQVTEETNTMDSDFAYVTVKKLEAPIVSFSHVTESFTAYVNWGRVEYCSLYELTIEKKGLDKKEVWHNNTELLSKETFDLERGDYLATVMSVGDYTHGTINSDNSYLDFTKLGTPVLYYSYDDVNVWWETAGDGIEYGYRILTRNGNKSQYTTLGYHTIISSLTIDVQKLVSSTNDVKVSLIARGDESLNIIGSSLAEINVIKLANPSLSVKYEGLYIDKGKSDEPNINNYQIDYNYKSFSGGILNGCTAWADIELLDADIYQLYVKNLGNNAVKDTVILNSNYTDITVIKPEMPDHLSIVNYVNFAYNFVEYAYDYKVALSDASSVVLFENVITTNTIKIDNYIEQDGGNYIVSLIALGDLTQNAICSDMVTLNISKQLAPQIFLPTADSEVVSWGIVDKTDFYRVNVDRAPSVDHSSTSLEIGTLLSGQSRRFDVVSYPIDENVLPSNVSTYTVYRTTTPIISNNETLFTWASDTAFGYDWSLQKPNNSSTVFGNIAELGDCLLELTNEMYEAGYYNFNLMAKGSAKDGILNSHVATKRVYKLFSPENVMIYAHNDFVFDDVEQANGYVLTIKNSANTNIHQQTYQSTSIDVGSLINISGEYDFVVVAKGENVITSNPITLHITKLETPVLRLLSEDLEQIGWDVVLGAATYTVNESVTASKYSVVDNEYTFDKLSDGEFRKFIVRAEPSARDALPSNTSKELVVTRLIAPSLSNSETNIIWTQNDSKAFRYDWTLTQPNEINVNGNENGASHVNNNYVLAAGNIMSDAGNYLFAVKAVGDKNKGLLTSSVTTHSMYKLAAVDNPMISNHNDLIFDYVSKANKYDITIKTTGNVLVWNEVYTQNLLDLSSIITNSGDYVVSIVSQGENVISSNVITLNVTKLATPTLCLTSPTATAISWNNISNAGNYILTNNKGNIFKTTATSLDFGELEGSESISFTIVAEPNIANALLSEQSSEFTITKLNAPELSKSSTTVSWTVTGANSYSWTLTKPNGSEVNGSSNSATLIDDKYNLDLAFNMADSGYYTFSICSNGDEKTGILTSGIATIQLYKLDSVTNLALSNHTDLVFTSVSQASKYIVTISSSQYHEVIETLGAVVLTDYIEVCGNYNIGVVAVGENLIDSNPTTITIIKLETPTITLVNNVLQWSSVPNGYYYKVTELLSNTTTITQDCTFAHNLQNDGETKTFRVVAEPKIENAIASNPSMEYTVTKLTAPVVSNNGTTVYWTAFAENNNFAWTLTNENGVVVSGENLSLQLVDNYYMLDLSEYIESGSYSFTIYTKGNNAIGLVESNSDTLTFEVLPTPILNWQEDRLLSLTIPENVTSFRYTITQGEIVIDRTVTVFESIETIDVQTILNDNNLLGECLFTLYFIGNQTTYLNSNLATSVVTYVAPETPELDEEIVEDETL